MHGKELEVLSKRLWHKNVQRVLEKGKRVMETASSKDLSNYDYGIIIMCKETLEMLCEFMCPGKAPPQGVLKTPICFWCFKSNW